MSYAEARCAQWNSLDRKLNQRIGKLFYAGECVLGDYATMLFFKNDETRFKAFTPFVGIVLVNGRFAEPLERSTVPGQDHIAARHNLYARCS